MKTYYAVCGITAVMCLNAFGGAEHIIKQHAKDLRDQNNARQGVPAAPAPSRPATQPQYQPAVAPAVQLTPQQQREARLQTAISSIKPGATPAEPQKTQLARDLAAAATGQNRPSAASLAKLADSLSSALAEKLLANVTRKRLAKDLETVLNPAKASQKQIEAAIADLQTTFETSGITKQKAAAVASDLKNVAAGTQKQAAK